MFLHMGGEDILLKKDIIAILDIKTMNKSQINKDFIKKNKNEGLIKELEQKGKAKSIILGQSNIHESSISSFTLKKRSDNFQESIEELEKKR